MDNIKNQNTVLIIDHYFTTEQNTIHWGCKVNNVTNPENYIYMPENNLTMAELFPVVATDNIKNDVLFGVVADIQPATTDNKIVNSNIKTEPVLPSKFLQMNQSFREEDSYIGALHTGIFSELAIKPVTKNIAYKCEINNCNEQFTTRYKLMEHKNIHIRCRARYCKTRLNNIEELRNHERIKHNIT